MDAVGKDKNFMGERLMRHQEFLISVLEDLNVKDAFPSPGKETKLSHRRDDLNIMTNKNGLTSFGNTIPPGRSESLYRLSYPDTFPIIDNHN